MPPTLSTIPCRVSARKSARACHQRTGLALLADHHHRGRGEGRQARQRCVKPPCKKDRPSALTPMPAAIIAWSAPMLPATPVIVQARRAWFSASVILSR